MKTIEMIITLNALADTIEINQDDPAFTAQARRTLALLSHEGKIWNELTDEQRDAIGNEELEGLNIVPVKVRPKYFKSANYDALKRVIPDLQEPETAISKLLKK